MKKIIIILILMVLVFGTGFYFRDNIVKFYNDFGRSVQSFQKTEIGNIITEAGREILTPPPLNIGGASNKVVLLKSKVIEETNIQRENNGLLALLESSELEQAAMAKASDMFENQYFEHVSPTGVGPGDLAKEYGYNYIIEGENLILGNFSSEKEVVQEWMDSPGHRANILNNRYAEIGVAVIKGTYKGESVWIGVQEFGLPLSSCAEPDVSTKNLISSNQTQLDFLSTEINQKRAEVNGANKRSAGYNILVRKYNDLVSQYNLLASETKNLVNQYNQEVNNFKACVAGQ